VAHNGVVAAGGRLTDWISLGVLASSVPRDAVDAAVAAAGKGAKRSDGKLPAHVMVYFAMAMALFADEDYEEVATRLTETLASWGCWDDSWRVPTSGGITQARQRLGPEPLELLFAQVVDAGNAPRQAVDAAGHPGHALQVGVSARRWSGPTAHPGSCLDPYYPDRQPGELPLASAWDHGRCRRDHAPPAEGLRMAGAPSGVIALLMARRRRRRPHPGHDHAVAAGREAPAEVDKPAWDLR
jgi:Insertion element 4 transposase N-terminal